MFSIQRVLPGLFLLVQRGLVYTPPQGKMKQSSPTVKGDEDALHLARERGSNGDSRAHSIDERLPATNSRRCLLPAAGCADGFLWHFSKETGVGGTISEPPRRGGSIKQEHSSNPFVHFDARKMRASIQEGNADKDHPADALQHV